MCGRFTLRTPMSQLAERFLFDLGDCPVGSPEEPRPRYNVAPSQLVAALRQEDPAGPRQLWFPRWGLIPSWAKDPAIAYKMINARGETVAEKPSFRHAFRRRRCLVLADGYYEWQKERGGRKLPFYIRLRGGAPFAFAGLWERWQTPEGDPRETCTIITTDANELTHSIHPRMPVILDGGDHEAWLRSPAEEAERLLDALRPYPSDAMEMYRVSTLVNSPKNESPACIEPLDEPPPPRQQELL